MTTPEIMTHCPSDETLASFIDDRLDPQARSRVIEHLSTCADCRSIWEAASDFASESEKAEANVTRGRFGFVRQAAFAAAAVLALVVALTVWRQPRGIDALVEASENVPYRSVQGRLTGGFPYKPAKAVMRGGTEGEDERAWALQAAAGRVAEDARGKTSRDARHARAVAYLVLGDAAGAIKVLHEALGVAREQDVLNAVRASSDWELLNDLSAAYYARGAATGSANDSIVALEAADRAWSLHRSAEVAWNRALAIETLHVPAQTRKAWTEYLEIDGGSEWANEARARLKNAEVPLSKAPDDEELYALASARDTSRFANAARHAGPSLSATADRFLFDDWSQAVLAADEARAKAALDAAARVGEVLRARGDHWVVDAVTDLRALEGEDRARAASALRALRAAQQSRNPESWEENEGRLVAADDTLRRISRPFSARVRVSRATISFYRGRFEEGLSLLGSPERSGGRYGTIEAQADWLRGILHVASGHPYESLQAYARAIRAFDRIGDDRSAAFLNALSGETLDSLGRHAEAWARYAEAVRISVGDEPGRAGLVAAHAAKSALELGAVATATQLIDYSVGTRESAKDQTLVVDAYLMRARTCSRTGDLSCARAAIRDAAALCELVRDADVRARAKADIHIAAGETLGSEAEPDLDGIIAFFEARKDAFRLPRLYLLRGQQRARHGAMAEAESDFARGVQGIVSAHDDRADMPPTSYEARALRPLLDEAMRFERRVNGERARQWVDALRSGVAPAAGEAIPEDGTTIVYWSLEDELCVWVSRDDSYDTRTLAVSRPQLTSIVSAVRDAARANDQRSFDRASAEAFTSILAPLRDAIARAQHITIVPDEAMSGLPFAAVLDPASKRRLIEDYEIAVSWSTRQEPTPASLRDVNVLAVTDPAFDGRLFPGLSRLARAREEGRTVAATFSRTTLLAGEAATRDALFAQLRSASVLHFAGHAVGSATRPGASALLLAPANGDRGVLYASDLTAGCCRNLSLVVLSACASASGDEASGISDVSRALFAAGVPQVVGSLWPVADDGAGEFMRHFYAALGRTGRPAAAMREAQLALLRSHQVPPSTWAAFTILTGPGPSQRS